MQSYKDAGNKVHVLDSPDFAHLLPAGCVEITEAEAAALNTPSLVEARATTWEAIKADRDRLRFEGGVQVAGLWFLTTAQATSEYSALVLLGAGLPGATILRADWRTMDDTLVDMTPDLARQILAAGFAQVAAIDDAAQAHKAALYAAPEPAEYDFSTGWPEIFEA